MLRRGPWDVAAGRLHPPEAHWRSARSPLAGCSRDTRPSCAPGTRQAAGVAQENPLGLAIGAAAIGFIGGLLIPSTRVEDEKIGPMADQVKEKARETGQEALERGKDVAQQAAQSAKDTAQETGREHADGLRESAGEKAQETREQAGSTV